jgi:hypothetical protein
MRQGQALSSAVCLPMQRRYTTTYKYTPCMETCSSSVLAAYASQLYRYIHIRCMHGTYLYSNFYTAQCACLRSASRPICIYLQFMHVPICLKVVRLPIEVCHISLSTHALTAAVQTARSYQQQQQPLLLITILNSRKQETVSQEGSRHQKQLKQCLPCVAHLTLVMLPLSVRCGGL